MLAKTANKTLLSVAVDIQSQKKRVKLETLIC